MNQILFTENKKSNNKQDINKIILVFAVMIILFGLFLSGEGVYAFHKAKSSKAKNKDTSNSETQIKLEQLITGEIQVDVTSQIAISELIYNWSNDAAQTISEDGETTFQEIISPIAGENILTVKTIDVNGKEVTKRETFISTADGPKIALSLIGDNIKIAITSRANLSYITYQWNNDNEERIDMLTYEDKTKLDKEIKIPKGTNTLHVKAVDVNNNNSEKSQEIKGITKPKSSPVIQGEYIYFEVTSDEKIKQVDFIYNNNYYVIKKEVIDAAGDGKKISYRLKLEEGMNYLKIKTTTESGLSGEDMWKYEYKK